MPEFRTVTPGDIKDAFRKDKGTKSVGVDEVPMHILKKVGPEIAEELAALVNACIRNRSWPQQWKMAEIIAIWKKKGDRQDPLSYRPISMLPAIARLVERVLAEQLKGHIRANSILPDFQHGFRAGHSTATAVIQLVDQIATAMDEGKFVMVASLDLAGAFDTVDKKILIRKLERSCGIQGAVKECLESYLQGRQQRVRKSEEKGGWKENPWGVPQGSVLGPLLFSLYCVDIGDAVDATISQYADDCTLVVTAETAAGAVTEMNRALQEFSDYAAGNRLAAEPTKTQLMMCSTKRIGKERVECEMDGHIIKTSETIKVLGVFIDNKLSWEVHNAKAAGKASGIARSIARGTRFLRLSDRATLMQALAPSTHRLLPASTGESECDSKEQSCESIQPNGADSSKNAQERASAEKPGLAGIGGAKRCSERGDSREGLEYGAARMPEKATAGRR